MPAHLEGTIMLKRILFFAYGVACYLVFLGTFAYAIAFVGGCPLVPSRLEGPLTGGLASAIAVNCGLLMIFAVQHSVMARRGFKAWWTQVIPWSIERSTYVLAASLALLLLFWQWRPIGIEIWNVENELGRAVLWTLFAAGWATVLIVTFLINHFDLFGLRQVWLPLVGKPYTPVTFRKPLPYRIVRHPLYFGFVLAFWATPHMTLAHLLFAIATTAYIVIAIQLEERDLVAEHGAEYAQYRREVPMLVPGLKPRRAELPRAHDQRPRQLVVESLLLRVDPDPDDPEHEREDGDVVGEVTADQLAGRGFAARLRVHDLRADRHLAGRRLAVDPEQDHGNRGQQPVDQEVRRACDHAACAQPVIGAVDVGHERRADDQHQDRVDDRGADARPEADVLRLRFVHVFSPLELRAPATAF